jgi:hypothetical protein
MNKKNVTIAGNTTLTGLSSSVHNLTVYAWDEAGNIGSSETITFVKGIEGVGRALVAACSISWRDLERGRRQR